MLALYNHIGCRRNGMVSGSPVGEGAQACYRRKVKSRQQENR
jgi:hypothetical protein